jgi:hypothetical protein
MAFDALAKSTAAKSPAANNTADTSAAR